MFEEAEGTGESLASRSGAPRSCVVNLRSADLVREVMKAKRKLSNNYLTSSDIKSELLGPASAACIPSSKIFINEMMPQDKFLFFKSLRPIAQGLGFKYVWHMRGKFLARRRTGECARVFASAADLQAIQTACQSAPKKHLSSINSPNDVATSSRNAVKGQGAAQVVKSALTLCLGPTPVAEGGDGCALKAGFLNINSIRPRINYLRTYLAENPSYHLFGIAESWLSPVVDDGLIRIEGYSVIRQDRNINGGGVALFLRDDFNITILATSNTLGPEKPEISEYLFCRVQQCRSPHFGRCHL